MHAAIVRQGKIWIYGGVTEPFGDPRDDMFTSSDGVKWDPDTPPTKGKNNEPIGKPIGCALQELNGELNLLRHFPRRKHDSSPAVHF